MYTDFISTVACSQLCMDCKLLLGIIGPWSTHAIKRLWYKDRDYNLLCTEEKSLTLYLQRLKRVEEFSETTYAKVNS